MADNSDAQEPSSPLRQIVRSRRALWWTGSAVLLIALVVVAWLERKRIHLSLPKWTTSPPEWFLPLGLVAGGLLALAALWKVPQWQVGRVKRLNAKERFDRVNEARKTLATVLGGIAFLVGGFFTLQNLKVAQEGASTAQRALAVSQEGQITDRFSKAIEQLGAVDAKGKKKLEVRLGGIYALERIANESERDHWPIMEVLCTYVRVNAPAPRKGDHPPSDEQKSRKPAQKNQASPEPAPLAADIQAILTVLGRRNTKYERENQGLDLHETGLNLHETGLSGADLSEANLRRANLSGADLSKANFEEADLSKADFYEADLSGADLGVADLSGAFLRNARGLTQGQIDSAKGDNTAQLPENQNLHMPESWKKK
jgi:hypothetical protein